jgi:hypothetical protein
VHGSTGSVGRAKIRRTCSQCFSRENGGLICEYEVPVARSEKRVKKSLRKTYLVLEDSVRVCTSNTPVRFKSRTMSIALAGVPDAVASLEKVKKSMAKLQSTYHVVYDRGIVSGREKKAYTICAQPLAYMSEPNHPHQRQTRALRH